MAAFLYLCFGFFAMVGFTFFVRFVCFLCRCGPEKFPCRDLKKCVPMSKTCDKIHDCDDFSDEDPISCNWKIQQPRNSSSFSSAVALRTSKIGQTGLEGKNDTTCPVLEFGYKTSQGILCKDSETLKQVDCKSTFRSGQRVHISCDEFYEVPKFSIKTRELFCQYDGKWSQFPWITCEKSKFYLKSALEFFMQIFMKWLPMFVLECGIYAHKTQDNQNRRGSIPWDAAIFKNDEQICGGSLIQDNFILSHANCVKEWIEFSEKRPDFYIFIRPASSNLQENFQSDFTHASKVKIDFPQLINFLFVVFTKETNMRFDLT